MGKKKFFVAVWLSVLIFALSLPAFAAGGSPSDPLVAKSWVDAYVDSSFSSLQNRITDLKKQLSAAESVSVTLNIGNPMAQINGSYLPIDSENSKVVPYIDGNGRTMVPVRFIAESMGAAVSWDAVTRQVTIEQGSTVIRMTVGDTRYTVNGVARTMNTAPVIQTGWNRTMVPVRFVAEALGASVDWSPKNSKTEFVYIIR